MPKPPNYRVIFNWDGSPHTSSEVPQTMGDLLENVYGPLENTQVGAHFWCLGDQHLANWESDGLEIVGEIHNRKYEDVGRYLHMENIREMLDRGLKEREGVFR